MVNRNVVAAEIFRYFLFVFFFIELCAAFACKNYYCCMKLSVKMVPEEREEGEIPMAEKIIFSALFQ